MRLLDVYVKLEKVFSSNGFRLYIVGGTTRDILLGRPIFDYDFATNARIDDMEKFLDIKTKYAEMSSINIYFEGVKIDITTLRKEDSYFDFRHPSSVSFVDKPIEDATRRDFTINAMYIDNNGNVLDYFEGREDMKSHIIRMIGDPYIRIKEDPLRILRALRFSVLLNYQIERNLKNAIRENAFLLRKLKYSKCLNEVKKMMEFNRKKTLEVLKEYGIDSYIPIDYGFNSIPVIDMHVDTITRKSVENDGLYSNDDLHVDIKKMMKSHYMLQCFAVFINLGYGDPFENANRYIDVFEKQMNNYKNFITPVKHYREVMDAFSKNKISALLTIEEGGVLEGNINNLQHFYNRGVRMMTLTWNYKNEIASPNLLANKTREKNDLFRIDTDNGLTPFGIEVVKRMNKLGMIIDVSHLSDKGFYDVIKYSSSPIVASHSNARGVCGVGRNLSDDMILKIKEKHGLIGINYCPDFLGDNPKDNQLENIVKHIKYIKELAGVGIISLGSDFDGIPTPNGFEDSSKMILLENRLSQEGFSQEELEKIFYKNFLRLLKRVCK